MRKKYRVGEGSEAGKWGEYGLSKSPFGVSEVMQGKKAGAEAYDWEEEKKGRLLPVVPAPSKF